jgi:hypothetical protein
MVVIIVRDSDLSTRSGTNGRGDCRHLVVEAKCIYCNGMLEFVDRRCEGLIGVKTYAVALAGLAGARVRGAGSAATC